MVASPLTGGNYSVSLLCIYSQKIIGTIAIVVANSSIIESKGTSIFISRSMCANIPLPLKPIDPSVTFFKSVVGTNFLSPTSQIFLVVFTGCPSVISSNEMTSAGFERLNVTIPVYFGHH